jgi:SAM-dependent methyltransferase
MFVRQLLEREDAFVREDVAPDSIFYSKPRMVSHLDATALATVERLAASLLWEEDPAILDLMASVDSHLPPERSFSRVTGLGMNRAELDANPVLSGRVVHDLNADPFLPFPDESFDGVLNVVSVEYLTRPVEVFREVGRVLKPGGLFLVVFSTRWFPPKVIRAWEDAQEEERIGMVEEFFRRAGAFEDADSFISMGLPRPEDDRYFSLGVPSDPIFAVFAEKSGGEAGRPSRQAPPDPAHVELRASEVDARRRRVGETMECPYCQVKLSRWKVPDDPCIDWPNDYLYICFNDSCPFVVRGWRHMWNQGVMGTSYRLLFDPVKQATTTVPIRSLLDLRPGIMEEDPAGPFRSVIQEGRPDFSGLPKVRGYGPEPGIPRG